MNKPKEGFILIYVLTILMIIGLLFVSWRQITISSLKNLDSFYKEEQRILLKYSLQQAKIHLDQPVEIYNSLGERFILK